jgi:polyhydroxyalkanoate synthesis regulator phasin
MRIGNIDLNKLRGFADKGVGFGKEIAGTFFGRDDLVDAGQAQQDKATEHLKALREEAKAQAREAEAEVHERRQRVAQEAK